MKNQGRFVWHKRGVRGSVRRTHTQFVREVKRTRGKEITVLGKYRHSSIKILVRHSCGHEWKIAPSHILEGIGCPRCKDNRRNTKDFLERLRKIHGTRYKPLEDYREIGTRLLILDTRCGYSWKIITTELLRGRGCPKCNRPRIFSNKAISWLKQEARKRKIRIRHGRNWGEYIIPGTRIRVDGFHKPSNTVFEFYGDRFHGNPKKFGPKTKCHPYSKITAGKLNQQTKIREKTIKQLGYNIVSIWQSDYEKSG